MCLVYLSISYLSIYLSIYLSNFLSISLYIWGCSQTKLEALYGMGTQANLDQTKKKCSMFSSYLLSSYELCNYFSSPVVSNLPSCNSVSYRFCILSEMFSHSKILYGLGQKILRTPLTYITYFIFIIYK